MPNNIATRAAERFYRNAISMPMIDALHLVNREIEDTPDANIYVFWGLHFSTFTLGESEEVSINHVGSRMGRQIEMYVRHLQQPLTDEVRDNDGRVLRRSLRDFDQHFAGPDVDKLKAKAETALNALSMRIGDKEESR